MPFTISIYFAAVLFRLLHATVWQHNFQLVKGLWIHLCASIWYSAKNHAPRYSFRLYPCVWGCEIMFSHKKYELYCHSVYQQRHKNTRHVELSSTLLLLPTKKHSIRSRPSTSLWFATSFLITFDLGLSIFIGFSPFVLDFCVREYVSTPNTSTTCISL